MAILDGSFAESNYYLSLNSGLTTNIVVSYSGAGSKRTVTGTLQVQYTGVPIPADVATATSTSTLAGNGLLTFSITADDVPWNNNTSLNLQCKITNSIGQTAHVGGATIAIIAPPNISSATTTSNFTGDNTVFIEGITTQTFSATVSAYAGATISSVTFTLPNSTTVSATESGGVWTATTTNASGTTGNFTSVCTATDSRGETSTANIDYSIKEHTAPTVNYDIYRCDSNGDRDMSGGYLSITVWAGANPPELGLDSIELYEVVDSNSSQVIGPTFFNSGTRKILGSGSIDPDESYTATFNTTDNAYLYSGTSLSTPGTVNVPTVVRAINVADGGTGIAFGKLATTDLADSEWPIRANGESSVTGRTVNGSYGSPKFNAYHVNRNNYELGGQAILTAQTVGGEPQDTWGPGRWAFRVFSYDTTNFVALNTYETYYLPYATTNRANNTSFQIVTTKSQFTRTVTLASGSWSSLTQTVTATGVTSSSVVMVSADPASLAAYTAAGVYCSAQGTNSLTFSCTTAPTANLTVNVLVVGV